MSIPASCPSCGNTRTAPAEFVGRRIKCLRCDEFFSLPGADQNPPAQVAASRRSGRTAHSDKSEQESTVAIRAVFWLGLVSLAAGLTAVVASFFPGSAGFCRAAA